MIATPGQTLETGVVDGELQSGDGRAVVAAHVHQLVAHRKRHRGGCRSSTTSVRHGEAGTTAAQVRQHEQVYENTAKPGQEVVYENYVKKLIAAYDKVGAKVYWTVGS